MELIDKESILKEIPLFSGLSPQELAFIGDKSSIAEYKKESIIYEEGQPADAFYCLVIGRVAIHTKDKSGNRRVLEYLHRGKYFGIISLLTADAHSVTAQAINDCYVLVIEKGAFGDILKSMPSLAIDLSRTLSRRLKDKDVHQKTVFETAIISVYSSYSQAGKTTYSLNLALSLKKETGKSLILLDICPRDKLCSLPQRLNAQDNYRPFDFCGPVVNFAPGVGNFILKGRFGIDLLCIAFESEDESCVKKLVGVLSALMNDYHYIILDLPSSMDRTVFSMLNQSDTIHILTSPEPVDLKRTRNLVERLKEEFHFQEEKIKVVINEYRMSKFGYQEQVELLDHGIFATLPKIEFASSDRLVLDEPDSEYAKAVRRIVRKVGDCQVGLVLGVGLAYGFCHIGVLKVIEEERIPVDVISGSSIGALIASLWATGRSSQEILRITGEFRKPKYLWGFMDFTFPLLGFIKGDKLYSFLKRHLGNKTFYDVKLPLKVVASDVKKKESIVFDRGSLVDAIMASCSMPGVFKPFRLKEDMLFDGGVINPLPTEVLFKMGVKKIIAVNVTPSREDILSHYEKLKQGLSAQEEAAKRRFSLTGYIRRKLKTNILDIIFSSIEIMQSEVAQKEALLADVVLHPDTGGLHWMDLHRAADFAKRGEEETRRNLDKIRQIVNE